ncbi:MAG TPA: chemotaxis protein CheD [Anaeromyxobacteraceae bacterium]|nr:chemotaxis protein CheD [Anaeromyxobacteraceae bacterium]
MGAAGRTATATNVDPPGPYPGPAGRLQVYLHAGQLHAAPAAAAVTTILGSCVSVCLFDPASGIGGMNHFLLPHHVEREKSARFGSVAIPDLVEAVVSAGARRAGIRAKVFGGASVLHALRTSRNLGEENAHLALRLLEAAHIPVIEIDVGGQKGRKLIFHSDDGSAWIRRL